MKTSGYIITGVEVEVVDAVVVIRSGAIVGDNDDSPALSLDRASLGADFTKSSRDVVVFVIVMDGVGGSNDKSTFLINSRLSDPLFITAESTTALCLGSVMAEPGLFGVVGSMAGSVVKRGNVPCLVSWSPVTCSSSSGRFTDILSSRSS